MNESKISQDALVHLVERIEIGDSNAEQQFFAHFLGPLMAMLKRRTRGDVQRAEDVFQRTCLIILERLRGGGIDDPRKIAGYIHSTAKFVLSGQNRKDAGHNTHADSEMIERLLGDDSSTLDALIRKESDAAVRELIGELKLPRDREVLMRYFIYDQPKAEICAAMKIESRVFDGVKYKSLKRYKQLLTKNRGLDFDED